MLGSHREIETMIREALDESRFTLFAQPVLNLKTNTSHYECCSG